MKKLFTCLFLMTAAYCFSQDVYVNGYINRSGTYVQPHYRTAPDNTQYNNFSTVGNVNPYTGKAGYIYPTKGAVAVNTAIPVNYMYSKKASSPVYEAIELINYKLLNAGFDTELRERIKKRFYSEYTSVAPNKINRYTDSSIVNWLYAGMSTIAKEELNNYSPNISGTYFYLKRKAILWDSPIMATNNSLGEVASLRVQIIEKANESFYKVKSGNKTGYITVANFKQL